MRKTILAGLLAVCFAVPFVGAQCTSPAPIPDADVQYIIEQAVTSICLDKVAAFDVHFGGTAPADVYEWAELQLARDVLSSPGVKAVVLAEAAQALRCGLGQNTPWESVNFAAAKTNILPVFELMAYARFAPDPEQP